MRSAGLGQNDGPLVVCGLESLIEAGCSLGGFGLGLSCSLLLFFKWGGGRWAAGPLVSVFWGLALFFFFFLKNGSEGGCFLGVGRGGVAGVVPFWGHHPPWVLGFFFRSISSSVGKFLVCFRHV